MTPSILSRKLAEGATPERVEAVSDRAAQLLEEGAELLEKVGWAQGNYRRVCAEEGDVTGYCAVGSVREAIGWYATSNIIGQEDVDAYVTAINALAALVRADHPQLGQHASLSSTELSATTHIVKFNDRVAPDAQAVLDYMQRAAKQLRTRGDQA